MLIDSHAHLTDERFNDDRDALVANLPSRGIGAVVEVACAPADFAPAAALAANYPHIYAAYGIHPHHALDATEADIQSMLSYLALPKAVALGEIGLDYFYGADTRERQIPLFTRQLELARDINKPVILHIRDAYGDCMDILRRFAPLSGVMHCFSGSAEIAAECVRMGLHIGFGGSLTFKNARRAAEAASVVPLDRLLIETDCPYMTPEPFRGRRNDPTFVEYPCRRLAELRGVSFEEMAKITADNARSVFSSFLF